MKKIFITIFAFACISFVFSNYTFSQTRNKSTTSKAKRAGSLQKPSSNSSSNAQKTKKRAATVSSKTTTATSSSQAKRAATTQRRAGVSSSSATRRAATRRAAIGGATGGKNSSKNSNNCPIGVVVKKVFDEDGKEVYYSAKDTTCNEPENASGLQGLNGLDLPTWIAGKDAYVFSCDSGFVKAKENNIDVCIDQNTICPLNTTISKKDNKYINPLTGEECSLPAFASTLKLNDDTNTDSTIPTDEAYYSFCKNNYYTTSDVECKACPAGKYTIGATIRYINITDDEGKIVGSKAVLQRGAASEEACYTQEEMENIEYDENGNMKVTATNVVSTSI